MPPEDAINGSRTRAEHPAAPVTPSQQAAEARAAVLEDALTLPDGTRAESNAVLVRAARRIIAEANIPR